MKLEIFFFVITIILPKSMSYSDEMIELARMLHKTCVEETQVDESLIEKVNQEKTLPDNDKLKCYIKCLMAQMACIDDDGVVDPDAVIAVLPEEVQSIAEPTIKSCGSKMGKDPCDSAWLTHKCYLEKEPKFYMLI